MKLLISAFFIASVFLTNVVNAQNSPEAQNILNKIEGIYSAYKGFEGGFSMTIENKEAGIADTQKGAYKVAGDMYVIKTDKIDRITNGESVWTVFKEDEEVQINYFDEEDEEFTPSSIFNLYKEGFTYPTVKDTMVNGASLKVIDLFPISTEESYEKITLLVNMNHITTGIVYGKTGTIVTYNLDKVSAFENVTKRDDFTFDEANYPDLDLDEIDLR